MTRPSNASAMNAGAAANQPLLQALGAFQQGRPADCVRLCETILAKHAKEPGALHLLGVARLRLGDSDGAVRALRQAAQYDARNGDLHANLGAALRAAGNPAAAAEVLRRAIALRPDSVAARYNLGNALADCGRHAEAAVAYREVVTQDPAHAAAHNNLGLAVMALGRRDEAMAAWRRSVAAQPAQRDAHLNLGRALLADNDARAALPHFDAAQAASPDDPDLRNEYAVALLKLDRVADAIAVLRVVVDRHPDHVGARVNLGSAFCLTGNTAEGAAQFDAVLATDPEDADTLSNLGAAFEAAGDADRARDALTRALARNPDHADALSNMGKLLCEQGRFEAAIDYYDRVLAIVPDHAEAQFGHAAACLTIGRFGAGWRSYRGRPGMIGRSGYHRGKLPGSLAAAIVRVDGDQGLGDEIFFLRFLPQLRQRGARVCYRADRRLVDMLRRAGIADRVASRDEPAEASDFRIVVGDLPFLLGHDDTAPVPPSIALAPLPERVTAMHEQLAALGPPPYCGLSWRAGTRALRKALSKEVPGIALAETLRDLPCTWIALQRAPDDGEIEAVSAALHAPLHDFTALNGDLESMLATLSLLDDYVCVSNTNVHLRAACGRACRILVPQPPEFRWMATDGESPWFPAMTTYRETHDGDWDAAFAALRRDLAAAIGAGLPRR